MSDDLEKRKSEYLLKLALEEQLEEEDKLCCNIENKKNIDSKEKMLHTFSKRHEKRMKRVLKKAKKVEKKGSYCGYQQKYFQLVAGVSLFLCVGIVTVTNVEAFRVPILCFFEEMKENYLLLKIDNNKTNIVSEKFQSYVPMYTPEDYVIIDVQESEKNFCIKYENSKNKNVYLYYYWEQMGTIKINTEGAIVDEIELNGNKAYIIQNEDEIRIHINKELERIYLNGRLSYEEALKVMESVEGMK